MIELEAVVLSQERVRQVGAGACLVNFSALTWTWAHRTDGFLPSDSLAEVLEPLGEVGVVDKRLSTFDGWSFTPIRRAAPELVERLTAEELWLPVEHGWLLRDASRPTSGELEEAWLRVQRDRLLDRLRKRRVRGHDPGPPDTDSVRRTPHSALGPPTAAVAGSNGCGDPAAAATGQSGLPLPEDHTPEEQNQAPAHGSAAWYASQLVDADQRTPAVIRSILRDYQLPGERALALAWESLQHVREHGVPKPGDPRQREPLRSEVGYFVRSLVRMGKEGLP